MNTATELLTRAYEALDRFAIYDDLRDEIEVFLAAEPKADKCKHRIADARNPVVQSGYVCVDCHALFQAADHQSPRPEPARKPMTEEEIQKHSIFWLLYDQKSFVAGVRFAEKHHFGIGDNE